MTPEYDADGNLVKIWVGREDTAFIDLLARIDAAQRARERDESANDER
jgi:hypothetical protein